MRKPIRPLAFEALGSRLLLAADLAVKVTPEFTGVNGGEIASYLIEVSNLGDTFAESIELSQAVDGIESANLSRLGFEAVIQMPPQDWQGASIDGEVPEVSMGAIVDSGDVNGDGVSDIIVRSGAHSFNEEHRGETYVYYGGVSLNGDLTPTRYLNEETGFVIPGFTPSFCLQPPEDCGGFSSIATLDFNGDGMEDIVLGAPPDEAGVVYVLFGSEDGFDVIVDVSLLDEEDGSTIFGVTAGDGAGNAVSNAGDVNGDGVEDLLILARGESYVVFGSRTGLGETVELAQLDGNLGFAIAGGGLSVPLGDVNGDRFADIGFSTSVGPVVVFGAAQFEPFTHLEEVENSIRIIEGRTSQRSFLDELGDINGDGIDDMAFHSSSQTTQYIIYGSTELPKADFLISEINDDRGFLITQRNNRTSGEARAGGDINGDGIGDVLVLNQYAVRVVGENFAGAEGEVYVVFGGQGESLDVSELDGKNGFAVTGPHHESRFGADASVGDVNGDGVDDLIVGAPGAGASGIPMGSVYVIFGSKSASLAPGTFSLAPTETAVFKLTGVVEPDAHQINVSITAATNLDAATFTSAHVVGVVGDLDLDGSVGFSDFLVLQSNFGIKNGATPMQGDLDLDGAVSFSDFLLLSANYESASDLEIA